MAQRNTDKRSRRFNIVGSIILAAAALVVVRYAIIMIPGSERSSAAGSTEIERGPILDRRGRVLAIQTRLDTVTAWKPEIDDIDTTARILADILDLSEEELAGRLATADGFLVVQRTITPSQSDRIRSEQQLANLPGIRLEADTGRSYPEREAAAPIIGFTGVDNVGLAGIEYMFSNELMPEVDTRSTVAQSLAMGNQVFLTLDLAIQSAADDLGRELLQEHQADSVMIVVGNLKNGQVLAVSHVPSFDPNHFREYSADEQSNRFVSRIYEPGSVFKVFSVASFLELGGITENDEFDTSGGYVAEDGELVITDLADYGRVTPEEIIKYSSNVGAAYASETVDPGSFYTILTRFGFGRRTGIDLNGEESGLLSLPENWSRRTLPTIAIGQEIGVTAVQVFAAATALANDGMLLRPQIVDQIVSPSGEVLRRFGREPVREVVSPDTARRVLRYMDAATEPDSTARRIQVEGVSVAAKTGTAEVYDPELNTYSDTQFIASTLAMIPADDPELGVYVMIDFPRGESFYGGRIAAPAADEMLEFLVPYWDIPRDTDTIATHPGRIVTRSPVLPPLEDRVPDYTGLPIRTLMPLLGREDIDVVIEGSGWVVNQDPEPGTAVSDGMMIRLELE
ncbi:MAG: penicillin-binding protein [Alkalispirochaeta sp.]